MFCYGVIFVNRKILCLILMVCVAAAVALSGCTSQTQDGVTDNGHGKTFEKTPAFDPKTASVTEKTVPLYQFSTTSTQNVTLYFINGDEIPYISLEEFGKIYGTLITIDMDVYNLTFKADGDKASYVRENGYTADFDFSKNTVYFTDLDMFEKMPSGALVDVATLNFLVAPLYQKDDTLSYERYGHDITLDLGRYGIQMLHKNDGYYIPLQTFSDIFLAGHGFLSLYDGREVIITGELAGELSDLYYSAPKLNRTKELAEFDYNELCFALDYHYGLKDTHRITDFDTIFKECGYDHFLKGTDQAMADAALYQFIITQLDDQHSSLDGISFRADKAKYDEAISELPEGITTRMMRAKKVEFSKARDFYYPKGIPHYEEVGNTAYITFDSFENDATRDYYSPPKEDELDDTIRLMQYACDRITRKDSPIENVVMDVSLNLGGTAYDAVYVIGTFLGEGHVSLCDDYTGALTSVFYKIDTNRDRVFDEKDTLAGKGYKFYCIETGVSFSCGNLVPNVFKNSNMVTLIGQTSGGGSCAVQPLSTAAGTQFQVSGHKRLSFIKNGAFYDIDRGAEPDIYIKDPYFIYDRKALTNYINNQIK